MPGRIRCPGKIAGVVLLIAVALALVLSGCASSQSIGPRPAPDVLGATEAYLQRYQPGPMPRVFQTSRYFDRQGRLLAERWDEGRRTWVGLDAISPDLINATIATEDATFFSNTGVDPVRIAGAALQNAQEGGVVSGASTITMQLARNLFLSSEDRYNQTMDRKMVEAGFAQELTSLFTKSELLEMYVNLLNYGRLAYGPEAAAQVYFGKSAADLTLAEATLLAGIPQNPAELDILRNPDAVKERQWVVLSLMVRHGYLTQAQADAAYGEEIVLNPNADANANLTPHFVHFVEEKLDEQFGKGYARRAGLQITTTLDLDMQQLAQTTVTQKVAELQPKHDLSNGALVALKPGSNEILVMVGSADFTDETIDGQVNVATSLRQPGSSIKPILYATALSDNLISPATVLWDIPVTYTISADFVYEPVNYDDVFHGPVTARTALANSYNIPAVKLVDGLTVPRMLESARAMGIQSLNRDSEWYGLSLTLGGGEVTLLDLVTAYATIANQGLHLAPTGLLAITDAQGNPIDLPARPQPKHAISPQAAYLVTDILSDNTARSPAFGANSALRLSRPAAAKTGTTDDFRDNWTLGYTPYLLAGVWAGNSDGRPMRNSSGLTGAAPIWQAFMEGVLNNPAMLERLGAPADSAAWAFTPPPGLERLPDCPTGLVCREGGEYFTEEWLQAASEAGPLADSVVSVPTAPVYADRGAGALWTAYCQTEPALARPLLALPDRLGLPGRESQPADNETVRLEQAHALAWSLRNPTAVNLGPCDRLGEIASVALAFDAVPDEPQTQVFVDLAAAMDPNAGPVAGGDAVAVAVAGSFAPGDYRFGPAEPVSHHNDCPGNYIIGFTLNSSGAAMPGVHIVMVDQWGNRSDAISKSGDIDFGRYDFPIHHFANQYTLTVVDDGGNPISPPVVINHLQADGGDASCHTLNWIGG
ncbi:MAG: transglycosylase domain-containing protein [Caldilineales bacterium]|nr:transglycosylase domain-containing protein [Caldilineales bacterium]